MKPENREPETVYIVIREEKAEKEPDAGEVFWAYVGWGLIFLLLAITYPFTLGV